MQIIEEIVLDKELFPGYTVIDEETSTQEDDSLPEKNILKGLSKINLFVGQNNSGKSRFLRHFINNHTKETLKIKPQNDYLNTCTKSLELLPRGLRYRAVNKDLYKIIDKKPNIDKLLEYVRHSIYYYPINKTQQNIIDINWSPILFPYIENYFKTSPYIYISSPISSPYKFITSNLSKLKDFRKEKSFDTIYGFIYIPTLRGLIHLDGCMQEGLFKDLYKERVKEIYTLTDCDVFSGLDFNQRIRRQLLGNLDERNSIQEYQKFLSEHLFNNQTVLLIPSEDDSEGLKIKIGDEKEQKIHNLGDGLQTLIILTYPPFQSSNEKVLYFIEEPELSLHPGLQRQLLEAFQDDEYFGNVQFFITTHSNHLLDISLNQENTSIYLLNKQLPTEGGEEKEPRFTIQNVQNNDCRMLDTLGVSNSSVFLSNCTIWVEGITDRLYLGKYLKLYLDKEQLNFKEDIHYSFIEYSGNNITHWSFLDNGNHPTMNYESITKKIFVILDMDNPRRKNKRKEQIKEKLPNNHAVLPCREIENLLLPHVIKEVLKRYGENNIESLKIKYTGYAGEYLGTYLDGLLKNNKRRTGKYAAKSGTISDKLKFCQMALNHINKWEYLSKDAQKLTIQIAEFIAQSNPKVPSTEQPIES